jgi:branched-chain amino acid transport system substrate-binding protein
VYRLSPSFGIPVSSFEFPISNLQFPVCSFQFPVSNSQFPMSNFHFPISNFQFRLASLLLAALLVSTLHGSAQAPPEPYAVIPRDAVNYSGPGRDAIHDLQGSEIKIGFLAPLTGPHPDEGKALLQAAQLAIEDEAASPLPEGRRLSIVPRDQSGPWGRTSNEVVHLVYEDQAVAIVTSLDGGSAHLAEQVGNKVGIPVVTLSSDPTTTQINLPWIFRLGPTDAQQARAFARDIYVARKLKQVVLITENGHDGRVGGEQFEKAARELNAPPVIQLAIDPADWNPDSVAKQIAAQKPDAVVFWTGHESAARLVPRFRSKFPTAPVYLCQEAAQGRFEESAPKHCKCEARASKMSDEAASGYDDIVSASAGNTGTSSSLRLAGSSDTDQENIWIVTPRPAESPLRESFEKRYRARAGALPTPAAAQAYDAVRLLAAALRRSGPNRARLRDVLAEISSYTGTSGVISFDHAGNDLSDVTLVRLP